MIARDIRSSNGLILAGYESGNSLGPEILFIHGFSQCSLAWGKQFSSKSLANEFRLIAFDIRGHGASEKPTDPSHYADDMLFADDVHCVMDAFNLKRPVLVTQGSEDKLVLKGLGEFTTAVVPGARLSMYEAIGHSPFAEDAPRFNRELAEFVRSIQPSSKS